MELSVEIDSSSQPDNPLIIVEHQALDEMSLVRENAPSSEQTVSGEDEDESSRPSSEETSDDKTEPAGILDEHKVDEDTGDFFDFLPYSSGFREPRVEESSSGTGDHTESAESSSSGTGDHAESAESSSSGTAETSSSGAYHDATSAIISEAEEVAEDECLNSREPSDVDEGTLVGTGVIGVESAGLLAKEEVEPEIRRSHRKAEKLEFLEIDARRQERMISCLRHGLDDGVEEFFAGQTLQRGVRATRKFRRGEFVLEYAGDHLALQDEFNTRVQKYDSEKIPGSFFFWFKYQEKWQWIDATPETNERLGRLVNHVRKSGNLKPSIYVLDGRPHIVFIASKDIEPEEQLLYDYGDLSKASIEHHEWLLTTTLPVPESDEEKENVGPAAPNDEQLRAELDRKLAEFVEAARVEMRAVSQLVQEDLTSLPQPIGPISMQVQETASTEDLMVTASTEDSKENTATETTEQVQETARTEVLHLNKACLKTARNKGIIRKASIRSLARRGGIPKDSKETTALAESSEGQKGRKRKHRSSKKDADALPAAPETTAPDEITMQVQETVPTETRRRKGKILTPNQRLTRDGGVPHTEDSGKETTAPAESSKGGKGRKRKNCSTAEAGTNAKVGRTTKKLKVAWRDSPSDAAKPGKMEGGRRKTVPAVAKTVGASASAKGPEPRKPRTAHSTGLSSREGSSAAKSDKKEGKRRAMTTGAGPSTRASTSAKGPEPKKPRTAPSTGLSSGEGSAAKSDKKEGKRRETVSTTTGAGTSKRATNEDFDDEDDVKHSILGIPSAMYIKRQMVPGCSKLVPSKWTKSEDDLEHYLKIFYLDYLKASNQLVLPEGAPVTFGSGDDGESYLMESAAPGDLVPGLTDRVPAAHREFARLPVGSAVEVTLKDFDSGVPEKLKATHWGQGILLLDRDRERICCELSICLRKTGKDRYGKFNQDLSSHLLNLIARSFFGGRSYVRLYSLGGSRGLQVEHTPFIYHRIHAAKMFLGEEMETLFWQNGGDGDDHVAENPELSNIGATLGLRLRTRIRNYLQTRQKDLTSAMKVPRDWLQWFNHKDRHQAKLAAHAKLQELIWKRPLEQPWRREFGPPRCKSSRDQAKYMKPADDRDEAADESSEGDGSEVKKKPYATRSGAKKSEEKTGRKSGKRAVNEEEPSRSAAKKSEEKRGKRPRAEKPPRASSSKEKRNK